MFQRASHQFVPGASGYRIAYRLGQPNACPGCGRAHWQVGRMTAECAFCATVLPITGVTGPGAGLFHRTVRSPPDLTP